MKKVVWGAALLMLLISDTSALAQGYIHTVNGTFTGYGNGYQSPPMAEASQPGDVLNFPGMGGVPYLDNYFTNYYAMQWYDTTTLQAVTNGFSAMTGKQVHYWNFNEAANGGNNPAVWASYPNTIRIINGIQLNGRNFFTIILPPQWNNNGATNTHPVVVYSSYDVNQLLYGYDFNHPVLSEAQRAAYIVARSPGVGAIGVIWNGGGSFTSITGNPQARYDFDQFMEQVVKPLGGKVTSTYAFGRSRGGSTALLLAGNPDYRTSGYKVKYVVAISPGVLFGDHSEYLDATMPRQLASFGHATGYAKSWTPGWVYPGTSYTAKQAVRYNFFGTFDQGVANSRSPASSSFINKMLADGTKVNLAFGSHDEFIPFGTQLDCLRSLEGSGIQVRARIVLGGGHMHDNFYNVVGGDDNPSVAYGELQNELYYELGNGVQQNHGCSGNVCSQLWMYYNVTNNPQAPLGYWTNIYNGAWDNWGAFPSTVHVPTRIQAGMEANIHVVGPRNAPVVVRLLYQGQLYTFTGTIPGNTHHLRVPFTQGTPGTYAEFYDATVGNVGISGQRPINCAAPTALPRINFDAANTSRNTAQISADLAWNSGCSLWTYVGNGGHVHPGW